MARVQLLSDIHFEFHRDSGRAFVQSLAPNDVDVLVLAGDIGGCADGSLQKGLGFLVSRYGDTPILMVAGNHEYYGASREHCHQHMKALEQEYPTFRVLENEVLTVKGQRFLGCTLWFPELHDNARYEGFLPDFRVIRGFKEWNYKACETSMAFLEAHVQAGDFVITHHIPSSLGIHPKYSSPLYSKYNRFFLCQMPQEVLARASFWVFGHTHESMSFEIGDCQFRSNPLAYPHEGNRLFSSNLILEG